VILNLIDGRTIPITNEQWQKLQAHWEKLPKQITINGHDVLKQQILGAEDDPKPPPPTQTTMIDALINQGADMTWYERSRAAKARNQRK
jgi:hypothetical protein